MADRMFTLVLSEDLACLSKNIEMVYNFIYASKQEVS